MKRVREARQDPTVVIGVLAALAFCLLVLVFLFLNASTHMVMKAKCSPLEDPMLEHKKDGEKDLWRASLRVEVLSHKSGEGVAILSPESIVYDSADEHWNGDKLKEVKWAMSHCLCSDCNGTDPGTCEICKPRTKGCDYPPPEYDCYVDVQRRQAQWPAYTSGVGEVRMEKHMVERTSNTVWVVLVIVFSSLACCFGACALLAGIPSLLGGDGDKYDDIPDESPHQA